MYTDETIQKKLNMPSKRKFFLGKGFSRGRGGGYNSETTGLGKRFGRCFQQIRFTDKS